VLGAQSLSGDNSHHPFVAELARNSHWPPPGSQVNWVSDPTPYHGAPGVTERVPLPPRIGAQFSGLTVALVALTPVFRGVLFAKISVIIFRFCPAVRSLTQRPTLPN